MDTHPDTAYAYYKKRREEACRSGRRRGRGGSSGVAPNPPTIATAIMPTTSSSTPLARQLAERYSICMDEVSLLGNEKTSRRYVKAQDIIKYLQKNKPGCVDQAEMVRKHSISLKPRNGAPEPFQYQRDLVGLYCGRGENGIIKLTCGAGKTYLSVWVILRLSLRTMILLPSRIVMRQWHDAIHKLLDIDLDNVLCLDATNVKTTPVEKLANAEIVLLTWTMLSTKDDEEAHTCVKNLVRHRQFGVTIVDECQSCIPDSAPSRGVKLFSAPSSHILGVSASLAREDQKVVDLGPVLVDQFVPESTVPINLYTLSVHLGGKYAELYKTMCLRQCGLIWEPKMLIEALCPEKIMAVITEIAHAVGSGANALVYVDRKDILGFYERIFSTPDIVRFVTGESSGAEVDSAKDFISEVDPRGWGHICFNTSIFTRGLDVSNIERIVCPNSTQHDRQAAVQRTGRCSRKNAGKTHCDVVYIITETEDTESSNTEFAHLQSHVGEIKRVYQIGDEAVHTTRRPVDANSCTGTQMKMKMMNMPYVETWVRNFEKCEKEIFVFLHEKCYGGVGGNMSSTGPSCLGKRKNRT